MPLTATLTPNDHIMSHVIFTYSMPWSPCTVISTGVRAQTAQMSSADRNWLLLDISTSSEVLSFFAPRTTKGKQLSSPMNVNSAPACLRDCMSPAMGRRFIWFELSNTYSPSENAASAVRKRAAVPAEPT